MLLCDSIRSLDGSSHSMVGILPAEAEMSDRLQALGYVEVETRSATPLGPAGLRFRGHQFRYSELELLGEVERAYAMRRRRDGGELLEEGFRVKNTLASYVHAHWGSSASPAEGFVGSCVAYRLGDGRNRR